MATEQLTASPKLDRIQRWMQACIQNQGTCEEAIQSNAAQSAIPEAEARRLVKASATLEPLERLDIYREMYLLRMEEALAIDYPSLKHFLGDEEFMRLVARYVDVNPSRSYTLNRLGDHLPDFIATLNDIKSPAFCHDLARLEYALTMVFDEQETPRLTQEAIQAVPQEAWENARLKPIAAFRLVEFDYPVSEYVGAVDEENPFPKIRKRKTYVAAYRSSYRVHRLDLSKPAYQMLSELAAGNTLGETLMASASWRPKVKESQLFEWFREWMSEGLFQAVEL